MREGLRADRADPKNTPFHVDVRVVWLTTKLSLAMPLADRETLLMRHGCLIPPGSSNLPNATVRLRMVIPTRDRRLAPCVPWLRRRGIENEFVSARDYWIYEGDVAPERLTVDGHVPRGEPWLEFPEIRDAIRDGKIVTIDPEVRAKYLSE
jgi:hypothetical protein